MADKSISPASWEQVKNRVLDTVSIKDFGAVGDGVADDTARIQDAINSSPLQVIHIPSGTYLVTDTITVPSGNIIVGDGAGLTTILAKSLGTSADLFSVNAPISEGLTTEFSGFTVSVSTANARYGIVTPQTSTTSYKPRYVFNNLLFRGENAVAGGSSWEQDFGCTACIKLGDCFSADIRDVQVWGTYDMDAIESSSPEQTGLYFEGTESLRNVTVDNYLTSDVKYGIDLGENNTSVYLSNIDCARGWYGIRTVATGNNGEFFATGCTFNAQRIGVELKNRSWSVLQGVHATRHSSSYDHSDNWIGFAFTGTNHLFVSNCRSLHGGTWMNLGDRIGWSLDDVLFSKFVNILCSSIATDMEYGFKIVNSSGDLMFSNVFFDDVGKWWDFEAGTSDINIGNHSHRGAVTTKYNGYQAVSGACNIHAFKANYHSDLLDIDPDDNAVNIGSGTLRVDDGAVWFGSINALGAETVTGFITINDAGGTQRKIAVIS